MKMGKRLLYIIFSTVLTVLSGHVANAQNDEVLMHYGDSLHMAYDFAEAEDVFMHLLDSLDVVEDSAMVKVVREKLRMSENGANMSRFVQVPQAAGKRRLSLEEFFLKVLCVVFVAAPRVGNINVGGADIFVVVAAYNRLHVCRNFTATVVFIPREEELCLLACSVQCLDDHQRGRHVSEVADVNRARGADARGANVLFLFGVSGDHSLSDLF